jgi:hypothetical protein
MALSKRKLLISIAVGIAALALIYIFSTMVGPIAAKENKMMDRLYELHDTSFEKYRGGWDVFSLCLFTSAIILFACGFIAGTIARPGSARLADWLKAPLAAACVPAAAISVYLLVTWYNDVQLYTHGGPLDGRPFEPMIFPVTLMFVGIIVIFCLGFSAAGGWLAWAALKTYANKAV